MATAIKNGEIFAPSARAISIAIGAMTTVVAALFIFLNKYLIQRPIFRNIPEGADVDISTLPGGDDELVGARGELIAGFEHLTPEAAIEAELA